MSTTVQPEAPTASPAPREQSITGFAHAEVMTDPDTGELIFCIATEQNLSDFQAATPSRGIGAAKKLREQADRIEALANEYAAAVVIPAFIEQYSIDLIETSLDGLAEISPRIAEGFRAFAAREKDNTFTVVVPVGQASVERLAVIRNLILSLQERAAAA